MSCWRRGEVDSVQIQSLCGEISSGGGTWWGARVRCSTELRTFRILTSCDFPLFMALLSLFPSRSASMAHSRSVFCSAIAFEQDSPPPQSHDSDFEQYRSSKTARVSRTRRSRFRGFTPPEGSRRARVTPRRRGRMCARRSRPCGGNLSVLLLFEFFCSAAAVTGCWFPDSHIPV